MQTSQRITLNVGGTRYTTTPDTLLSHQDSYFSKLLTGDWQDAAQQSEMFVDRDGELFKHVMRFLRASPEGKAALVDSLCHQDRVALLDEAKFFQLETLIRLLNNRLKGKRKPEPSPEPESPAYQFQTFFLSHPEQPGDIFDLQELSAQGWELVSENWSEANEGLHILLRMEA